MVKMTGILLLVFFAQAFAVSSVAFDGMSASRTVAEDEHEIDFHSLPDGVDVNEWEHHMDFFNAVRTNKKTFEVSEKNDVDTRVSYTMSDDKYFLLDDHVKEMKSISDSHLHHCSAGVASASIGDVLVGSTSGDYVNHEVTSSWLDVTSKVSPNTRENLDGIMIMRRVLSVQADAVHPECFRVETENIVHPYQLFDNIEIHSVIRNLGETPDGFHPIDPTSKKISKCDDTVWNRDWETWYKRWKDAGSNWSVKAGFDASCAQLSKTFPRFSWNRNDDSTVKKANIPMGDDVYCKDCYAALGATINVIVQFTKKDDKTYIRMKSEIGGTTDVKMNVVFPANPTFGGRTTGMLVKPDPNWKTYKVSSSLSVDVKNDGIKYTSISAGKAVGKGAEAGFSASGTLLFGAQYVQDKWNKFSTNQLAEKGPYFNNDYKTSRMFVYNSLKATESIRVTVDVNVMGVTMKLGSMSSEMALAMASALKFSNTVRPRVSSVNIMKNALSEDSNTIVSPEGTFVTVFDSGSANVDTLEVGKTVSFDVEYEGLGPAEGAILFFSIVPESGVEIPITEHHFVTSADGSGKVTVDWKVPSNERFVGSKDKNTRIRVRTSHDLDQHTESEPVTFNIFTASDGSVITPLPGDVVDAASPISLKWDSEVLSVFEQKHDLRFDGVHSDVEEVVIDLVGELLNEDGSVLETTSFPVNEGQHFANDGMATFSLPIEATDVSRGHRFYFVISSPIHREVSTWSQGTFSFAPLTNEEGFPQVSYEQDLVNFAASAPLTKHLRVVARNHVSMQTSVLDTSNSDAIEVQKHSADELVDTSMDGHVIAPRHRSLGASGWNYAIKMDAAIINMEVKTPVGTKKPFGNNGITIPLFDKLWSE